MTFYKMNGRENEANWEQYINNFFNDSPFWNKRKPAVDVIQQDNEYLVTAELPGYAPDQIDIQIIDGKLSLNAKANKDEGKYLIKERCHEDIERVFALPKDADTESISASFSHGLLKLTIQRKKPESRKVNIKF